MAQEQETISKAPSGRVSRASLRGRNRLTVKGKEPGYEYRIVNDIDDRIQEFKDAGYEPVLENSVTVGDSRVSQPSPMGSVKHISVGQGTKAILMRTKREYYDEDQAAKLARIAELENATTLKAREQGNYGSITIERK